ncbi:alpha/beta fold hydrolase [Actinomyces marmotae]|uniref:alpha/beta fold hydrolase n=1 Tax=Actinomyces marmotae TaxID=2737173 RepID=UPI00135CE43A|nr:alpha/beta hydrolase [Actinomyces marmotae]
MTDAQDRWESRFAEHTVHRRPGEGPTVVLLNGCGLASVAWDAVVEALPGRAIIAVDRPGRCGTVNDGLPDLRQEAGILARIIGDDAPAIVVAHSMAAFQAEALVRLHPRSARGIVLADPAVEVSARSGYLRRAGAAGIAHALGSAVRVEPVRRLAAAAVRYGMRHETSHPEVLDDELWRACHDSPEALAASAAEFVSYGGQAADLAALRAEQAAPAAVPAILLDGKPFHSASQEEALASAFSHLEIRRLPGSCHLMMLDAPGEIARAVDDLSQATAS